MSTPVGSSQWMYTPASGFYPYLIDQSLRFDGSSAYLNFTPSSSTTNTVTISAWVKRSKLGVTQYLFASGVANARGNIGFNASDQLFFQGFNSTGANSVLTSSMLFRDVSAWYHIVIECDGVTTTSNFPTNTNVYVNGSTVSMTHSTASTPTGGFRINDTQVKHIGALTPTASSYFSGYMAEVHWIDGTALDATSFGETINGVWVPKEYTGSHGSAGYYLSFADSAAIGDDLSGNTNDWTANNLAASDVVPDSPTNNFATLNAAANFMPATLTEGNLKATPTSSSDKRYHSTFPISSGKWYCEIRIVSTGTRNHIGFWGTENTASTSVPTNYARLGVGNGSSATSGTFNGTAFTASAGDILTYAFDADDGKLYFGRNAAPTIGATADFTGLASDTYVLGQRETGTLNTTNHFNFGQDDTFAGAITAGGNSDDNGIGTFKYAPPSGFLAMCSANLPEPAIGPNSDTTSDEHFNVALYQSNGGLNTITGLGHQPNFLWIKQRDSTNSHAWTDSVRGATKALTSNATSSEYTYTNGLQSFDSDGFTLNGNNGWYNSTTVRNYVAWSWKAGGTAVSNTDGSITSSVSANPDAGFSIVSYTGTGSLATVGHGLSSAPEMVIIKNRDTSGYNWVVGSDFLTSWAYILKLNLTDAQNGTAGPQTCFNSTAPTSSVFTVGTSAATNNSTDDHIAYCFHSSDVCKVGSYVGNGSTDGTFVYTGFRPAWIMVKATDLASQIWLVMDNKRDPDNVVRNDLNPNDSTVESSNDRVDFLSNGFKWRNTYQNQNNGGTNYIYLAFAEQPFKYANAR